MSTEFLRLSLRGPARPEPCARQPKAPSDRAQSVNYAAVNAPLCYRKVRGQTREGAAMPEPRERIARALSRLQGHPSDIRFEGKPMWHSFLPEADAALAAADIDPLIALLRQIEAHAAVPEALRDQAAAVLREYAAGRRASVLKAKTPRPQTNAPGTNL